jgi:tRNA A-37 threonylcarbamoyl transferase component Bud32
MNSFFYKDWRILSAIPDEEAKQLFNIIQKGDIVVFEWLKQHSRSDVMAFNFKEKKLVLKIPKEKNRRKWIRFTTLYRSGEAFKNLQSMDLLEKLNIPTTTPVMAAEEKVNGMVKDSWLVYEYLEGESCQDQSKFPDVVKLLEKIHRQGYLHGDAQIRNFINAKDRIAVIDANPSKPLFRAYAFADEFAYLARSAPEIEGYFKNRNSFLYRMAKKIELQSRIIAGKKRRIKNLFRTLLK